MRRFHRPPRGREARRSRGSGSRIGGRRLWRTCPRSPGGAVGPLVLAWPLSTKRRGPPARRLRRARCAADDRDADLLRAGRRALAGAHGGGFDRVLAYGTSIEFMFAASCRRRCRGPRWAGFVFALRVLPAIAFVTRRSRYRPTGAIRRSRRVASQLLVGRDPPVASARSSRRCARNSRATAAVGRGGDAVELGGRAIAGLVHRAALNRSRFRPSPGRTLLSCGTAHAIRSVR